MSTLHKIIQAQDRIVQHLALCEKTIGELYALYATCHPGMAEFWSTLAAEERIHAATLEGVRSDLQNGTFMHGLDHFTVAQVQNRIDFVRQRMSEAREHPTTEKQAVSIALSIESSIIDSRFFEFAKSDGSAFQQAAHKLVHETSNHIRMVEKARQALA